MWVRTQNQFTKSNGLVHHSALINVRSVTLIHSVQNINQFLPFLEKVVFSNCVPQSKGHRYYLLPSIAKAFPNCVIPLGMVKK